MTEKKTPKIFPRTQKKLDVCLEVKEELNRFMDRLDASIKELETPVIYEKYQSNKYAATKRSSLDLSEKLAKLRKPTGY